MNTLNVSHFKKICRICTGIFEKLISITFNDIIDMIKACTKVQIFPNDELPNQICELCLNQLKNAFNLKNLCEKSDGQLREIYEKEFCKTKFVNDIKSEDILNTIDDHTLDEDDVKYEEKPFVDTISSGSESDELQLKLKENEKYNCELCNDKFDRVWRLGIHMRRVHNAAALQCTKCSLICYHKAHLDTHEKTHLEKKLICEICDKIFANSRKLKKHKIAHSTDRPYHCNQCDKSFKEKCVLTQHIKKIHINPDPQEVCQICGKSVGKASLERHLTIHNKRSMFPCTECPKKFYKEISLTKHFKHVHQKEALQYMYLCNICGRGLLSKAELRRHLCTHTGEKPFECNSCDKRYNDRGALRRHIKSAHLDERPWSCTVCSRAFHTKIILQNHMRKHTGERPFQCLICGKSFGFKTVLQTHMKIHS